MIVASVFIPLLKDLLDEKEFKVFYARHILQMDIGKIAAELKYDKGYVSRKVNMIEDTLKTIGSELVLNEKVMENKIQRRKAIDNRELLA